MTVVSADESAGNQEKEEVDKLSHSANEEESHQEES
jgi:hypothetical protein